MGAMFAVAAEWLFGAATVAEVGGAALVATEVMAPIVVTAGAGAAAAGLTAAELAGLGLAGAGAAAAGGAFDGSGGSNGPGDGTGYPPDNDSYVSSMTQEQGMRAGVQDAGWTWKEGVGWARNALGLANLAAGLYGSIQNGRYTVKKNEAAANSAKLSAEDAARRAKQIETYGLDAADKMQPWDENGGRKLAGDQLKELMNNPMGVASNDPAYKFRQQAAARAMGIYGQDSGAMGIAAADASSTWYDQRLQQLAGLAGANAAPGAGGVLGVNSLGAAANIAGMGQASGAFGDQAAIAGQQAGTAGAIGTLGAIGNFVNGVGNMYGQPGASTPPAGPTTAVPGGTDGPPITTTPPDLGFGDPGWSTPGPVDPGFGDPGFGYSPGAVIGPKHAPAPGDQSRNAMSHLGGYTAPPGSVPSQGDFMQRPDMWQSQMGDLLGNYLGQASTGRGSQRIEA